MTILDTLDDEDSSSSWQPLSMTALAFLFMVSVFVRLILSCSKSGSMLVIWVVKTGLVLSCCRPHNQYEVSEVDDDSTSDDVDDDLDDSTKDDDVDESIEDDDIDESTEDDDVKDFLKDNDDNDEYLDSAEIVDLASEKRNTSEREESSWP